MSGDTRWGDVTPEDEQTTPAKSGAPEMIVVGSCPTCGALAQSIAEPDGSTRYRYVGAERSAPPGAPSAAEVLHILQKGLNTNISDGMVTVSVSALALQLAEAVLVLHGLADLRAAPEGGEPV